MLNGLNIEKFDWEPTSSGFSTLEFSRLLAFDFLSALDPFSTDFLDFASPLSYFDFLDLASFGGLSAAFYLDLLLDFSLMSLSAYLKIIIYFET